VIRLRIFKRPSPQNTVHPAASGTNQKTSLRDMLATHSTERSRGPGGGRVHQVILETRSIASLQQLGTTIRPSFCFGRQRPSPFVLEGLRATQKLFHSRRTVKPVKNLYDARRKKPPSLVPRLRGLTGKGLATRSGKNSEKNAIAQEIHLRLHRPKDLLQGL
jgi:hypothetical protein